MNTCVCGGEVDLDYQQANYTGQFWVAVCRECGKEVPLKADNRIDAEREWNNMQESE